jgi:hypothetical protein
MLTDELNSARHDRDRLGAEVKGLQGQVAQLQAQGEASAQRLRVVESEYEFKLSSAMGGWLAPGAACAAGAWGPLVALGPELVPGAVLGAACHVRCWGRPPLLRSHS